MKLECRKIREDLYGKIGASVTEKIGDTGWVVGACPDFRLLSNLYQNENKIRNISFFSSETIISHRIFNCQVFDSIIFSRQNFTPVPITLSSLF